MRSRGQSISGFSFSLSAIERVVISEYGQTDDFSAASSDFNWKKSRETNECLLELIANLLFIFPERILYRGRAWGKKERERLIENGEELTSRAGKG